jgi:hypothetical protein
LKKKYLFSPKISKRIFLEEGAAAAEEESLDYI